LGRVLRPRSIALVGASADPRSFGGFVQANLQRFGYASALHLVSRSSAEINGLASVKSVDELPEGIDLAVLPIGDNFTMGPDDALRALELLRPKAVLPVHYGTWDLIAADAQAWAARVREKLGCAVHVLSPGESVDF